MYVLNYTVHNYKSLRNVNFNPDPLTCLVGANAAGKSNLADSFNFLSEIFLHGLEMAIARKGGYENIAYRRQRRSKAPISFDITIRADPLEFNKGRAFGSKTAEYKDTSFALNFKFSIQAQGSSIKSDYIVESEEFTAYKVNLTGRGSQILFTLTREGNKLKVKNVAPRIEQPTLRNALRLYRDFADLMIASPEELLISKIPKNEFTSTFFDLISRMEVFQLSPYAARRPGVPTPSPRLAQSGENLPALVDWVKRKLPPHHWETVIENMKQVVPGLEDISVQYLHRRTVGLQFHEAGITRPWTMDDVSDGTIQALSMLIASVDPRTSFLFIEEVENCIHPWIINMLVDRLRAVCADKNVFITTHSPTVIDRFRPENVWIVSRDESGTHINNICTLEPNIKKHWDDGVHKLSEFLDAGFIPQAVPGGGR